MDGICAFKSNLTHETQVSNCSIFCKSSFLGAYLLSPPGCLFMLPLKTFRYTHFLYVFCHRLLSPVLSDTAPNMPVKTTLVKTTSHLHLSEANGQFSGHTGVVFSGTWYSRSLFLSGNAFFSWINTISWFFPYLKWCFSVFFTSPFSYPNLLSGECPQVSPPLYLFSLLRWFHSASYL